jgi:outer membrane cobalamin receptor
MKMMETYTGSGEYVEAYEQQDFAALRHVFTRAASMWMEEWQSQGAKDYGSCTGGKGLQIWTRAPRKRSPNLCTVVHAPPVQGNLAASYSHKPALDYLKQHVTYATYYDGWMD